VEGKRVTVVPLLVLRHESCRSWSLGPLLRDRRFEVIVVDALTPRWIAFARRTAGTVIAGPPKPLAALTFAATAGVGGTIVMLLHGRDRSLARDCLAGGCAACFVLPLLETDGDRLFTVVAGSEAIVKVDSGLRLLLDPISLTVLYRGRTLRLSQRAFALLFALSLHDGRPVSAQDLLTEVWADTRGAGPSRELLEFYVSQLRKKLALIGLSEAIQTVRTFGYSLALNAAGSKP